MSTQSLSQDLSRAAEIMAQAKHLVLFTGAGISTESGLPDFRGPDGVWTRRDKGLPPPKSPRIQDVKPNAAHRAVRRLQDLGRLGFLISQNVDNLHLASGLEPSTLAELHGNVLRVRCCQCERTYSKSQQPAVCDCGHRNFKSSVINFGDNLPQADLENAWAHSERADVFLVIGSTLLVTPAADMPRQALDNGAHLIIVNLGPTPLDSEASVLIRGKAGEVVPALVEKMEEELN